MQAEYECGGSKQDRGTPSKSLVSLMAAKSVPKKQQYNTPMKPANVIYLYLSWFMNLISRISVSIIPISYNLWMSIQIIGYVIMIIIDAILSASSLRTVAHKCYWDGYLGMKTPDASQKKQNTDKIESRIDAESQAPISLSLIWIYPNKQRQANQNTSWHRNRTCGISGRYRY